MVSICKWWLAGRWGILRSAGGIFFKIIFISNEKAIFHLPVLPVFELYDC